MSERRSRPRGRRGSKDARKSIEFADVPDYAFFRRHTSLFIVVPECGSYRDPDEWYYAWDVFLVERREDFHDQTSRLILKLYEGAIWGDEAVSLVNYGRQVPAGTQGVWAQGEETLFWIDGQGIVYPYLSA